MPYYYDFYEVLEKKESRNLCGKKWLFIKPGIPGNVIKDSGECSRRFRGMFKKIQGNVRADSGECSERFRGMFKKIAVNLNFDLFLEILLAFYQILLLNCYETMKNNYWAILLKKTFSSLRLITSLLSYNFPYLIIFSFSFLFFLFFLFNVGVNV